MLCWETLPVGCQATASYNPDLKGLVPYLQAPDAEYTLTNITLEAHPATGLLLCKREDSSASLIMHQQRAVTCLPSPSLQNHPAELQ